MQISYGLQSPLGTGSVPRGMWRKAHVLWFTLSWLNQDSLGQEELMQHGAESQLVILSEGQLLSVPLPANILLIYSSAALSALWRVECSACLAVSLDTALDLFRSKNFPFGQKRNVFWGTYDAAEVSRSVFRFCWRSQILSQGEPYTYFSLGPHSSNGCNPLSVLLFPYKTLGSFQQLFGWNNEVYLLKIKDAWPELFILGLLRNVLKVTVFCMAECHFESLEAN